MKRKTKLKTVSLTLFFLVFWLTFLYILQCLLVPKYQTSIVEGSMISEYYREDLGHEVIMIGDCEIYENISPVELWREYGITSYLRGSAQQLVWQSYYLLEDTLRYETPKVVVFNVLALKYDEPQKEAYNRMTLDGMRWSPSKVNAIKASMVEDEHFIDYMFPLLRYHSRWSELTREDFTHLFSRYPVTHNGYYMRVDVKPQGEFPDPMPLADYTLGKNAMSYLDKMTALCKEKGIELVLIKAPTEYPHWYKQWDEQITDYANKNDLSYINFIPLQDEIGLDMSQDTYDAGLHLNLSGAEKLSRYFGKWLRENCDLTDYRNDSTYRAAWEEKIANYENQKAAQEKELLEEGKVLTVTASNEKEYDTMKKLWIPAIVMVLCLLLAACGSASGNKTDEPGNDQNKNDPIGNETGKTPTPKNDGYTLTIEDTVIAIDAPMAPIVTALGEPSKYFESESCAFQGLDKVYTYGSVVIRTYPLNGVDYVLSIELKDDTVSTAEGVCIGDGKDKLSVYETPVSEDSGAVVFSKNGVTLSFILENDSISAITYAQTLD